MLILGIDPGYERLGWGILEKHASKFSLVACGVIQTSKLHTHPQRLREIHNQLLEIISRFQPEICIIEKLFFATNAKTAMNVSEARGVILLSCEESDVEIKELTPLQIKSAVTGDGHADKKAVEKMVRLQVKNVPTKLLDDTLDAIAAAISVTHASAFA